MSAKTGVVILTAGMSWRMEQAKALLRFNDAMTFIQRIISVYSEWGSEKIVVVANNALAIQFSSLKLLPPSIKIVINEHPEFERFYSVKLGLKELGDSEYCFIQNIDNPFITVDVLDEIVMARSSTAYVSPVYKEKGGHPILLNRSIIEFLRDYPENDANLKEVLGKRQSVQVQMKDDTVLININNRSDYKKYL